MDEADLGSRYAGLFLSAALADQLAASAPEHAESAEDCGICGDPIPEARRLAVVGCQLCVDCQADVEGRC